MEQEDKLCDEVETVWEFTNLGDRAMAGGGCEDAVTAKTRCGWIKLMEFGEFCICIVLEVSSLLSKNYPGVAIWQEISTKSERGCL